MQDRRALFAMLALERADNGYRESHAEQRPDRRPLKPDIHRENQLIHRPAISTLDELKAALLAATPESTHELPLSNADYRAGFEILSKGSSTYNDFIIPQLTELLTPIFHSRLDVSVLEVGPGPASVLESLPDHLKRKIRRYTAFEPNDLYASELATSCNKSFPGLDNPAEIIRAPFGVDANQNKEAIVKHKLAKDGFYIVLFCHSLYAMPKRKTMEAAIAMLARQPSSGQVIVFHRDKKLHFDGLVCCKTASYPVGTVAVANEDDILDKFAAFIAGRKLGESPADQVIRRKWRKTCRKHEAGGSPSRLIFSAPTVMFAFNQHSNKLPELQREVPLLTGEKTVKSAEARHHRPACIVRPSDILQVQACVRWAVKYDLNLTIVGGGHSGQCLRSNVVAVDMSGLDQVDVVEDRAVVQSGCTSGDVISKLMDNNLTTPLGARPSVGFGLILMGGISHIARSHGLACDSIVGAVLVELVKGEIFVVGEVPSTHQPAGAVRPQKEGEILWGLQGAGTNFGIVISVVLKTCPAPQTAVTNWIDSSSSRVDAGLKLAGLNRISQGLPNHQSCDVFLYHDKGKVQIGATLFQKANGNELAGDDLPATSDLLKLLGTPSASAQSMNSVELFDADMYVSSMHGGHGGGKTSAFKRCIFLKSIADADIGRIMLSGLANRPTQMCYMHLLHGGGAVSSIAADATAFGCRDWSYACVITGIWPREHDGTKVARDVTQWVYDMARKLLPLSSGVYGADLGQDPRDTALAMGAFGRNTGRLARLKHRLDPSAILPYACPLPRSSSIPQVIFLIAGKICAGKDFCAPVLANYLTQAGLQARVTSISDVTKREYAAARDVDAERLLGDRAYKEEHRAALTAFFSEQVEKRPWLPEEHFLYVVHQARNIDVLLVTGLRDEAPVTSFSHLVPQSRVIEVRINASKTTRRARGGMGLLGTKGESPCAVWQPDLIFDNDSTGEQAAKSFAEERLLPFFDNKLDALQDMVRSVANFPNKSIDFQHVLDIAQRPGGLALCTSLLKEHFAGDWSEINAIACCESGGFVFGSALAPQVDCSLLLIREEGKLPPPVVSSLKAESHISAMGSSEPEEKNLEMNRDALTENGSVLVVDDVLASGKTLNAILRLLVKAGIPVGKISVMVVAEFPEHRGRQYLWQQGFGAVRIQSLIVFEGA